MMQYFFFFFLKIKNIFKLIWPNINRRHLEFEYMPCMFPFPSPLCQSLCFMFTLNVSLCCNCCVSLSIPYPHFSLARVFCSCTRQQITKALAVAPLASSPWDHRCFGCIMCLHVLFFFLNVITSHLASLQRGISTNKNETMCLLSK